MTCRSELKVGVKGAVPRQMTSGSVGFDLKAVEDVEIEGHSVQVLKTGVFLSMPHNLYAHVMPRSGLAANGALHAIVGTIDSDYRGEVGVILCNARSDTKYIKEGMRIAQLVFCERAQVKLEQVDELDETERGTGGFGSTGA